MPPTQKSSGTTAALTPGAAFTSLLSTTGLTAGEELLVWVDTTNLAANQALAVEVKRAALVGGTAQQVNGSPMLVSAGFIGQCYLLGIPASVPYSVALGVIGGSATPTVPWSIEQLDR